MTDTSSQPQQHHLLHPHEVYSNPTAGSGGYQQQQNIQQQQHGDPRQPQHHLYQQQQAPPPQGQAYPMVREYMYIDKLQ
jgi:hypothetical protein